MAASARSRLPSETVVALWFPEERSSPTRWLRALHLDYLRSLPRGRDKHNQTLLHIAYWRAVSLGGQLYAKTQPERIKGNFRLCSRILSTLAEAAVTSEEAAAPMATPAFVQ
eukprot:2194504-Prymnesium_polylepis.1